MPSRQRTLQDKALIQDRHDLLEGHGEPGRNTVAAMFDGLRDGRGQEAGLVELKAQKEVAWPQFKI